MEKFSLTGRGSRSDPRGPHRFSLFLYKNVYYQFGKFPAKFRISEIDRRFVTTKILQPMQTRNLYELVTPNLGPKKGSIRIRKSTPNGDASTISGIIRIYASNHALSGYIQPHSFPRFRSFMWCKFCVTVRTNKS